MGACAQIQGTGHKHVGEAIVFDGEKRPTVLQVVVVELVAVPRIGAGQRATAGVATIHCIDGHGRAGALDQGDVHAIHEEAEHVIDGAVGEFDALL